MTQIGIGRLGLPLFGIDPYANFMDYTVDMFATYSKAANELPIGQAIKLRLEADDRVRQLNNKMLCNGRGASQFSDPSILAAWFLWRANLAGEQRATEELEKYLNSEKVVVTTVLWVHGIECKRPVSLSEDVQLVNIEEMPDCADKEAFLRSQFGHSRTAAAPAPVAALTTQDLVNKVVPELPFADYGTGRSQLKLLTLATILNCLPNVCCTPGYSTGYLPIDVPLGPFAGRGGGTQFFDILPHRRTELVAGQEGLIADLLRHYETKQQQVKDRLQRALFRLAQAKGRLDFCDRALDLGIALEMLLLNNLHDGQELPGQLSLHFRLRGSWLAGGNASDRRLLYSALGKLYALRSQVAHNGYSNELLRMDYNEREALLAQFTEIAERIFRRIILNGMPSDWTSLILGQD